MINGVDVKNLRSTIDTVAKDPEEGHYTFQAVTSWSGGAYSTTRIRNFCIECDEPSSLSGTDRSTNAVELVLAALGGCLSVGVSYAASLRGITIRSLRIDLEGNLDIRGFFGLSGARPGYEQIRVTVHLDSEADRTELESLLERVIRTSPVVDIVTHGVPVRLTLAD